VVAQLLWSAQYQPCPARSLPAAPATPSGGGAPYAAGHRAPMKGHGQLAQAGPIGGVIEPVALGVVGLAVDVAMPDVAVG
jgi:hypothetical protein